MLMRSPCWHACHNAIFSNAQVLQSTGAMQGALSCSDMVVSIWSACLSRSVLGLMEDGQPLPPGAPVELPVGRLQLVEVVEMLQVGGACCMRLVGPWRCRLSQWLV